ncbi:hypothetical protein AB0H71_24060 [Nocardia sp. NPDC050697]|uniref:hypothetical protein n=1 Tax=Nocardia sp. NPDC050697 TaxID=3155158 RepID=UPI0033FFF87B
MGRDKQREKKVPAPKVGIPAKGKSVPPPNFKVFKPKGKAGCLRIRLTTLDVGGPWCLSGIGRTELGNLLDRLQNFETMQRQHVFAPGQDEGKQYDVDKLPSKAARDRLTELEFDDETKIARLRIGGKPRLYGFLRDGSDDFWALWWDPEHEIWPSAKRNT